MFGMMGVNWYLLSIIIFIGTFAALLFRDRKNIEVKGILFIRRTKKGRKFLDRVAGRSPKFWKILGSAGVLVCFMGMAFGFNFLVNTLLTPTAGPSLSLVIPFPTQEATLGYGYIGVPFWYFIISVVTLVFVHEGMHGILARAEKIRVKNLGLLLLAVIPGAFVEPDEKQLKKANWKTKLRIYAGGSFANFLLAGTVFLFFSAVISPTLLTGGVGYVGYVNSTEYGAETYPAQLANMTSPIMYMGGERVENMDDLSEFMEKTTPGQKVAVETYNETYELELAGNPDNPEQGFMGIAGVYDERVIREEFAGGPLHGIIKFMVELLNWIFIINLGVGLVNIFPIKPLDGGLMVEALGERFLPKYKKGLVRFFSALFLSLIIANFLVGFL